MTTNSIKNKNEGRSKSNNLAEIINDPVFQRILLSTIALVYSLVTFFDFGLPEVITNKLKANIPSLTLGFLALVTAVEISDRTRQEKTTQEARRKIEKLSDVEENLISRCTIELEGESPINSNFLHGTWFSLYQDQNGVDHAEGKIKWATEVIEIIELGSVLYLSSKVDEQQKMIQALGRRVKDGVILGHWINCKEPSCKQGEFLLEISHDGKYLFGFYNRPTTEYKHFYKWILVKAFGKDKESILRTLDSSLDEAWSKMQHLQGDDLSTIYSATSGFSKYEEVAESFEKLISKIQVID